MEGLGKSTCIDSVLTHRVKGVCLPDKSNLMEDFAPHRSLNISENRAVLSKTISPYPISISFFEKDEC